MDFPFPTLYVGPGQKQPYGAYNISPELRVNPSHINSSLPTVTNPFSKFKLFNKMARELQLLVGSFALPDPRTIQVSIVHRRDKHLPVERLPNGTFAFFDHNTYRLYSKYKHSALFAACYASRVTVLKTYKAALHSQLGHPPSTSTSSGISYNSRPRSWQRENWHKGSVQRGTWQET